MTSSKKKIDLFRSRHLLVVSLFTILYSLWTLFSMDIVLLIILGIDFLVRSTNWIQKGLFGFIAEKVTMLSNSEPKFLDNNIDKVFARIGLALVFSAIVFSYLDFVFVAHSIMMSVVLLGVVEYFTIRSSKNVVFNS